MDIKQLQSNFKNDPNLRFKYLFIAFIALMGIVIPIMSTSTGINGDERFQVYAAKNILPFYSSFGKDTTLFHTKDSTQSFYHKQRIIYFERQGCLTPNMNATMAGQLGLKEVPQSWSAVDFRGIPFKSIAGIVNGYLNPVMNVQSSCHPDSARAYAYTMMNERFNIPHINDVPAANDLRAYGGIYELPTAIVNSILGNTHDSQLGFHKVRHVMLGIYFLLIVLFTGLLAKEFGGWQAAFIASIIIFLSPRFLGHGMMNPKDIPFALGFILGSLFIVRFIKEFPKPTWQSAMGVAAGIGVAVGARANGVLLLIYFGLFCIVFWWYYGSSLKKKDFTVKNLRRAVLIAIGASVSGFLIGMLFWPYGLINPIGHTLEVLTRFSDYPLDDLPQIWEGKPVPIGDMPATYLPKMIMITAPLLFIAGVVAMAILVWKRRKEQWMELLPIVLFVAIFPILYIIYKDANVYNGMRHVLFVYPPMVVLASLGWSYLLDQFSAKQNLKRAVIAAFVVLSLIPLRWIATANAHQYVYFNPIVGGTSGAYGEYMMDYWMLGVKEASSWIIENGLKNGAAGENSDITIISDCDYPSKVYMKAFDPSINTRYVKFGALANQRKPWNYGIFYTEHIPIQYFEYLKEGQILGNVAQVVHVVNEGDAVLAIVVKPYLPPNAKK